MDRIVVAGGGLAGARTAAGLREQGFDGEVVLLAAEPHSPYDRPPLSKAVLRGDESALALDVDLASIDVRLSTAALAWRDGVVDTTAGALPADALVVATGAGPVRLAGDAGMTLHTLDDARRLRAALRPSARVVVVGAGWIGAEVTTAAAAAGCSITVVEAAAAPLATALGDDVGGVTARWWREAGADLRLATPVAAVEADRVHLADGTSLAADVVVVAVGVRPAVEWLSGSGVAVDGGVLVDDNLRSLTDRRVVAVGDAAVWHSRRFGRPLRVLHWDDALHAPDVAVATLLGRAAVHDPVPYFWSEQFGRTLQYVGHHPAADRLLWRGDPTVDGWAVAWLAGDRLVAFAADSRPRDVLQARRLIAAATPVDADVLSDVARMVRDAARP